ncbi:MAG: GNAT family N-acetyltransferase [Chromatiales bacterium]|jgi:GNAT superfamily N-acetyltransferase
MKILDLAQQPEQLETLAHWHQQQWQELNPGETLQQRIRRMQAYLGPAFIPSTFIALGDELYGSAAIVTSDMDNHPELTPWLASVYVAPSFRNRGIGARLVQHVMQQAAAHGIERLFLFTPDRESFYQRLGWRPLLRETYRDHAVVIMQADL